ncbi:hypothetical protein Tco_0655607 [Tanacetum coccineum]|uniref:Integrase, catalytic region, zinc finger, CCHC-type, peptidase aspartic, catalytic n=1 Tax=Tanacetum coccineum TaxID=301880 RepID=A0ABQ4X6G3_9ASTR
MDSMIQIGQKNTLAEYMILSGADNRPPMLDKDLYDSWKSIMELYMQNREHVIMILKSVKHGPLIWPTVEENGVTRTKKYAELSATEKSKMIERVQLLMQGTSLIKQERECKLYDAFDKSAHIKGESLHNLLPEWSKFMTDVKLVKDLHTTNYDQLHAYLEQHELHANEVQACPQQPSIPQIESTVSTTNQQTNLVEFPQIDFGLAVPVFKQGDDPIDAINKMMSFLSTVITSRFPSTNNQLRNSSNPRQQATIHDGRVKAQGNGKVLNEEELEFLADLGIIKLVPYSDNTHNDMLNQSVQEMSYSEQTHLVNYLENEITSDSNIIPYSQYLFETQNAGVQDIYSSTQQDAMIVSVFEQLSHQVTNCNSVNKDNLMANETLSVEPKRYKERVKLLEERQNVDLGTREKLIIDDIIRDKDAQNLLKQSNPMVLEKKVNIKPINYAELNRLSKDFGKCFVPQQELSDEQAFRLQSSHPNTDQSASSPVKIEAPRELSKITPDALTEGEWGFKHTKAVFQKDIIPFLKTLKDIFNVFDKHLLNEVTKVQTVFNQMEDVVQQYSVDKQCFEIQKKQFLIEKDRLLDQIIAQDIVNIVVNSSVDMNTICECEFF